MDDELTKVLEEMRAVEIGTRRQVQNMLAGQYRSAFRGRGMDFDQVREYVPGDDIRAIDWNVTARTGRPFIKVFSEERQLTLMLLVDVSASGHFGSSDRTKREVSARIASTLAFSAIHNSDQVGLILFSDEVERYIPPGKGRRHVLRIIHEIISAIPESAGTDIPNALDFANRVSKLRTVTFLISDFLTSGTDTEDLEELKDALALTHARHDLVAVRVRDPREESVPNVGVVTLEDSETHELVEVNTSSKKLRARFSELAAMHSADVEELMRRAQVDSLTVGTDQDPIAEIGGFLKRRERQCA